MKKIILYFILFMSCNVQQKTLSKTTIMFDKQGHRGCRGLMPENTIMAMLKAIDLGVTTLEMDVVFTKDKQAVVSHESWFGNEITTKPDGSFIKFEEESKFNIYKMSYDEVTTFDVGLKPHPRFPQQQKMKAVKPLLSELLENVEEYILLNKRKKVFYNIETKSMPQGDNIFHPEPKEFVELLMKEIYKAGLADRVIIQSFDFRTLQYLHQHYPNQKTAMLIEDFDKRSFDEQLKALGFTATIYSPAYSFVNEILIKKCHEKNIKIIPWTVNDKEKIDELKALGVDGIITDYPNLFNN